MTNYILSANATIGKDLKIKQFSTIEDDVEIGDNVEIGSCVLIADGARIGNNVKIFHGASIGTVPQDLKFNGEKTTVEIGDDTVVREFVTLNRATSHSKRTIIGKNCFIMAYAHVAHACRIGDNVILANSVQMGGHVEIGDWVIVGGLVAIHQFVKIGKHAMIGGGFRAVKDVPPYILAGSLPLRFEGINLVGLRRRGFTNEQIKAISQTYDILYRSGLNVSDAVVEIEKQMKDNPEAQSILDFIKESKRGIIRG
ncbi:MAG: acyl-ACP--UDP-N-acetylglucosamine O-acyltransferase [Ignavibacteria bacterium]|nr:acyl-ACP--UDP-N-acetylglucosamine O-acyltransferase [Ignavibacteria bacterium]